MTAVKGLNLTERFPLTSTPIFGKAISITPGMQVYFWGEDSARLQALFRHLIGESKCERETKWLDGQDISHLGCLELTRLGVSASSARLRVFQSLTIEEHFRIRTASLHSDRSAYYWLDWAREQFSVLRSVPRTVCGNFSGGEQQSLMLALASTGDPKVIILEEPWTGLSIAARQDAESVFHDLAERGTAILYISQDAPRASNEKDVIVVRL